MDDVLNNYWAKALVLLERNVTEVVFNAWITKLIPLYMEDNVIILKSFDDFSKATITSRYIYEIKSSIKAVTGNDYTIKIVSPEDLEKSPNDGKTQEELIKTQNFKNSNLISKYIFDTFVIGKSNELAYAAAVAVAEAPGRTNYNPLFLYGGVGLGKTHLMHSIGNYVLEQKPDMKVLYVSTETFTNELINSILHSKNQEFRNKYRKIDVLLIDDIQFLSNKEGTQEEFFYTFNTLYGANKQIVISSDQPPKEIKTLEDRLRSRFGCGLVVDITLPDFETRSAILEKKAKFDHILIPNDVKSYIAKNIVSNIRELEGALNKVTAFAKLSQKEITIELAEKAIKDMIEDNNKREITVDYIQDVVANYYNITSDDIRGKKRTQTVTYPRQIAMYLSRKLLDLSSPKVGMLFGGRDHSTIIHGCDKITDDMEKDHNLRNILIELENRIKG